MGKNCNNTGKFKKIQQPLHLYNINLKRKPWNYV